jgi:hypothetical protein
MLTFVRTSPLTGKTSTRRIDVTPEEFSAWRFGGVLIQNAMPRASADDREFLMTGYTPEDWEKLFPADDRYGDPETGSEDFLNEH